MPSALSEAPVDSTASTHVPDPRMIEVDGFSFFYGADTASKLNLEAVPANEIILKPELLK